MIMRLSEKDDNEKKTMNTHLHIIEAYANLYSVWPDQSLKESIAHLLDVFDQHIIDPKLLILTYSWMKNWNVKSSLFPMVMILKQHGFCWNALRLIDDKNYIDVLKS